MTLSGTKFDCHRGTSFHPEKRAEQEKALYDAVMEEFKTAPPSMIERLKKRYDLYLARKGRVMSTMIAGPAKFPTAYNNKRIDSTERAWQDLEIYKEKIRRVMAREEKKEKIEAAGGELEMAKRKLRGETKMLESMKEANKIVRSKPKNERTPEKMDALELLGFGAMNAEKLFIPDYSGKCGFPSYSISNCRARVKATQNRVNELERREDAKSKPPMQFEFKGGSVVLNTIKNRIEIYNDEKPPRDVIEKYKSRGFRWARLKSCWQRQITTRALWDTEALTGVILDNESEL